MEDMEAMEASVSMEVIEAMEASKNADSAGGPPSWGHTLLLFYIRNLELYRLLPLFEGPFQESYSFFLQRILRVLVCELPATHRRVAHMCSLFFWSSSALIC